jgi:hypothetical protein
MSLEKKLAGLDIYTNQKLDMALPVVYTAFLKWATQKQKLWFNHNHLRKNNER